MSDVVLVTLPPLLWLKRLLKVCSFMVLVAPVQGFHEATVGVCPHNSVIWVYSMFKSNDDVHTCMFDVFNIGT